MFQISKAFDQQTMQNIVHSIPWKVLDGALVAAAIAALNYLANVHVADPTWAFFLSFAIPQARKVIQEWYAGQPQ